LVGGGLIQATKDLGAAHRRLARSVGGRDVDLVQQGAASSGSVHTLERRPVEVDDQALRSVGRQGSEQRRERWGRGHGTQPGFGQHRHDVGGRHAAVRPPAPVDTERCPPEPAPVVRQRVQKVIRGGIGAETTGTPHRGAGREQDEEVQLRGVREPMQRPRAVDLRPEDRRQGGLVRLGHGTRDRRAGRVDHASQRMRATDQASDHVPHPLGIPDVRGDHRDGRSLRLQLTQRRDAPAGWTVRRHLVPLCPVGQRRPAREDEVPSTHGYEPPGHVQAEPPQAARDEIRGVGLHRRARRGLWRRLDAHETGDVTPTATHGDLVLIVCTADDLQQCLGVAGVRLGLQIDERSPQVRVLQGDHPPQTPQRGLGHGGSMGLGAEPLRPARDEPEPRPRSLGMGGAD
jgi:hypothetical protein